MSKLWGQVTVERTVYDLAIERVERAFELFDEIIVSFSGGKDSTAVLNVTLEVAERLGRTPVRTVFFDEEAIPYQTEEYVRRVGQDPRVALEWYALPLQCRNACSRKHPHWWPWAPEDEEKWVRPMPPEAISSHPTIDGLDPDDRPGWAEWAPATLPTSGSTGLLLGIRASESLMRQRSVTMKRHDNFINTLRPGVSRVVPIYDWQTEDVWTAPAKFGWDYNRAYDLMEMLGIGAATQRCAPPFGEEPLGGLWHFREAYPEIWAKMADRVPGANTAVRYAKTELYGFGGGIEKPPGMTWRDFLVYLVNQHTPEVRRHTSHSIATLLRYHHSRVDGPVAEKAKHPATGISWRSLASIAMRGDLKSRRSRQTAHIPDEAKYQQMLTRYTEEIDRIVSEGRIEEIL